MFAFWATRFTTVSSSRAPAAAALVLVLEVLAVEHQAVVGSAVIPVLEVRRTPVAPEL
jgi:hypothetical protein